MRGVGGKEVWCNVGVVVGRIATFYFVFHNIVLHEYRGWRGNRSRCCSPV